jgi:gluconate 2-dehydrogenase gamma chain
MQMQRRAFIVTGVAVSAAACGRRAAWRFFTPEEAMTVEALCACIIPEDQDAGAVRAGVVAFIDTQLDGLYKRYRKTYREGIVAIDRDSISFGGAKFSRLPREKQVAFLERMERNAEMKPFFDLLVAHSMQGFYGDPRHGGNRGRVSWKMLGLPYPPLRGRRKDNA